MALSPYYQKVKDDGAYLAFQFSEESPNKPQDYIRGLEMSTIGAKLYRQPSPDGMGYSVKFNGGYFTTLSEHFQKDGYAFGFEFWTKMSGVPDTYPIQRILHRNGCFSVEINIFGQMRGVVRDGSGDAHTLIADVTAKMTDNEWHHYFFNYDGTAFKMYIDGVEADSLTFHEAFHWPANARFAMAAGLSGNTVTDDNPYFGWIDSFAFYKNSHTQDQIEEHWLLGVEPTFQPSTGLVSNFGFRNSIGIIAHEMDVDLEFGFGGTINSDLVRLERGKAWWDYKFPYRRKMTLTAPPNGLEEDHPMYLKLSKNLVRQNKVEPDLSNIRMAYLKSVEPQEWVQLEMNATTDEQFIYIQFPLYEDLDANEITNTRYFLYYGSRAFYLEPLVDFEGYDEWFFTLEPDANDIDYTHPGKDWKNGVSLDKAAKATLAFYGDRIRIWANTGPDQGIAEVQINELAWQRVDLYSPVKTETAIMTARDLPAGLNTFRFRATGQNNPASLGASINFTKIQYAKNSTFTDSGEEADDTRPWGSVLGGMINVIQ